MITYSVWYGLTGSMVEYTPDPTKRADTYSVRAYDIVQQSAYYIKRTELARILSDGRKMAHMSVAVYRNGYRW